MCWCAFLESAWCPVWDPRRQPGAWGGAAAGSLARILAGVCARAGQTRIGDTGGSYPDRERARSNPHGGPGRVKSDTGRGPHHEKKKRDAGFYQRLFTGLLTKVFTAPSKNLGFYLGLVAPGFYLGKNLGRSPGVENPAGGLEKQLYMLQWVRGRLCDFRAFWRTGARRAGFRPHCVCCGPIWTIINLIMSTPGPLWCQK